MELSLPIHLSAYNVEHSVKLGGGDKLRIQMFLKIQMYSVK